MSIIIPSYSYMSTLNLEDCGKDTTASINMMRLAKKQQEVKNTKREEDTSTTPKMIYCISAQDLKKYS